MNAKVTYPAVGADAERERLVEPSIAARAVETGPAKLVQQFWFFSVKLVGNIVQANNKCRFFYKI